MRNSPVCECVYVCVTAEGVLCGTNFGREGFDSDTFCGKLAGEMWLLSFFFCLVFTIDLFLFFVHNEILGKKKRCGLW